MDKHPQQQPNTSSSQSTIYYLVDGSRKRRQIDSSNSTITPATTVTPTTQQQYEFSKRPPKPANGDGEILSPGQGRQQITKFREQIGFVANAIIKDQPTINELARGQRFEISSATTDEIIDDDTINEEEYIYDSATTSTTTTTNSTTTREQQQQQQQQHPHQRTPYYVVVNAPERQQIITTIDPSTCTDVTTLQESLNHANNCLIDLLEQQRKLKHQNSILRARYNVELNRTDDFQRILLERNLRMKQIVSENVRWNVRYTRLKQHFGEEDVNNALGELAPK